MYRKPYGSEISNDIFNANYQFLDQVSLVLLLLHCQYPSSSVSQFLLSPLTLYLLPILEKPLLGIMFYSQPRDYVILYVNNALKFTTDSSSLYFPSLSTL